MLNSIRPDTSASPRGKGEARTRTLPGEGFGKYGDLRCGKTVSVTTGVYEVGGDGMVGSWSAVNEGSQTGASNAVHGRKPEEASPVGDRVSVVVRKRGNARGAKGDRKVNA